MSMRYWVDTVAVLFAVGVVLLLATRLFGCAVPVDVTVGVKLDDRCLLELPDCEAGRYSCGHYEGTRWVPVSGCRVACAAGRTLVCSADGPECMQTVGDGTTSVPVVCAEEAE